MKSRGVYETPGGTLLYTAHSELEQLVLDRRTLAAKDLIAPRYADLVYEGRWWTTEREAYDAFVNVTQERITGSVALRLYKGSATVIGPRERARAVRRALRDVRRGRRLPAERRGRVHPAVRPLHARARAQGPGAGSGAASRRRQRSVGAGARRSVSALNDEPTGMTTVTGEPRPPAAEELAENERSAANGRGAQDATAAVRRAVPQALGWAVQRGPCPGARAVNRSIGTDFRLWPFDIRLSKAWAVALWNAGILTLEESRRIEAGLDAVATRFAAGETPTRDRRRRAHDDRPAPARGDRRRRVEAAHRPQPERPGIHGDPALVHGCVRQARRGRARPAAGHGAPGVAASGRADAVVHPHAARPARVASRTGCCLTSGRSIATALDSPRQRGRRACSR